MSVKASLQSVKVTGVPVYLGVRSGTDSFSASPDTVMNWLCDGWRSRFNQHRSTRQKWVKATLPNGETKRVLIPIGREVTDLTNAQVRAAYTYLSAIPELVLHSPEKIENTEWFAATKRRKTLIAKGKDGGAMPRFRARKKTDQTFVCWFNGGRNAVFHRTGKRTGTLTITGRNPVAHPRHKGKSWALVMRVRTRQDIGTYTSVQVNWTRKTVVFITEPSKTSLAADAAKDILGVDRGKLYATSDGALHTVPAAVAEDQKHIANLQRTMGRMRSRAKKDGRDYRESRRYRDTKGHLSKVFAHQTAVRNDWLHQLTTDIARNHTLVALEDLKIKSMTASVKGKGHAAKARMNRAFLNAAPSTFESMLTYKHAGIIFKVPAPYTSQRCHQCGHTARENRESQAVFRCVKCGHTDNADRNAAKNIALVATKCVSNGAVDTASADVGVVVIPEIPTGTFADLYGQRTVDHVRTRRTPSSAAVRS